MKFQLSLLVTEISKTYVILDNMFFIGKCPFRLPPSVREMLFLSRDGYV